MWKLDVLTVIVVMFIISDWACVSPACCCCFVQFQSTVGSTRTAQSQSVMTSQHSWAEKQVSYETSCMQRCYQCSHVAEIRANPALSLGPSISSHSKKWRNVSQCQQTDIGSVHLPSRSNTSEWLNASRALSLEKLQRTSLMAHNIW